MKKKMELIDHTLCLTKSIRGQYQKALFITEIAKTYSFTRNKNSALKLLLHVLKSTEAIKNNTEKVWILNRVANVYSELGKKERVNEILSRSFKLAVKIKKGFEDEKNWCLHEISRIYAKSGLPDKSFDVLDKINDDFIKTDVLVQIADYFVTVKPFQPKKASQSIDNAFEIASNFNREDYKGLALSNILNFYSNHRLMFNMSVKKKLYKFTQNINPNKF